MIFSLSLLGCLINEAVYERRLAELSDLDGDGSSGEFDCDDGDPTRFPLAQETCNSIDDDCDGTADEEAIDAPRWYLDADGDSVGTNKTVEQTCVAPSGYSAEATDCDDQNADVNPSATEVPYNGIDEDCSGADLVDVDGDGFAGEGEDCDDSSADRFPGALEICFDDVDQDCDGVDSFDCDGDGVDAIEAGGSDCDDDDATTHPGAAESWHDAGEDNDCDGRIDDPIALDARNADVVIGEPTSSGYTGGRVGSVPDFDGDGLEEVWVTAPYDSTGGALAGAVYLLPSAQIVASGAELSVETHGEILFGGGASWGLGGGASAGAFGEEGAFVLSAPGVDDGRGELYAVTLSALGSGGLAAVDAIGEPVLIGDEGSFIGIKPMADQDVDGDGQADLFCDALGMGPLYFYSGPAAALHTLADADVVIAPSVGGHWLSAAKVGDVDGDGYTDFGVVDESAGAADVGATVQTGGSSLQTAEYSESAALRFVGGTQITPVADVDASTRYLMVLQFQASIFINPSVGATLDPLIDADYQLFRTTDETGFATATPMIWLGAFGPAYVLGAPLASGGSGQGECVVWQSNEFAAGVFSADLQVRILGGAAGDDACRSVGVTDDYNGDGFADLVFGAPAADGDHVDSGRAYLQFSP